MTELHFPDGQVLTFDRTAPEFGFCAWLPPRLSGPPAHRHRYETETFTVVEGAWSSGCAASGASSSPASP